MSEILTTKSKIYVAGHNGLVGSALVRRLAASGVSNVITAPRRELDLTDPTVTHDFLRRHWPEIVLVAAAKVGGIGANVAYPADFIAENLAIAQNVILSSWRLGIPRLLFLGSGCMYPKHAAQPINEEALLSGPLEPTNEPYAVAKIAGLKLCESIRKQSGFCYHTVIPNNLYGPGDNYHPQNSHVLPALLRRFVEAAENNAPQVTLWGSGTPLREFTYSDDLADACLHLLRLANPPDQVNVGSGEELSIRELAQVIAQKVGYSGHLIQDTSKPDGVARKLLDTTRIKFLGWKPKVSLSEGLDMTIPHFKTLKSNGEARL